jgi:hypothetical protein
MAKESCTKFSVNNFTRQAGGLTSQRTRRERKRIQICENRHRLHIEKKKQINITATLPPSPPEERGVFILVALSLNMTMEM